MLSCLSAGAIGRATPCYATFSPTGDEQFPFFSNSSSFWEPQLVERWRGACYLHLFLPSPCQFSKAPCGPASGSAYRLPTQLVRSSTPPCSRGGRPVSAKPIGKQRSKIYFPVSFPSPMSKHSNRSRKSTMRPQFLLTMISLSSRRVLLRRENLTNLKIYDIIYLQGEGRKKNLHHHLHYA